MTTMSSSRLTTRHRVAESPMTAVVAIWASTAVASLLAPDMVTGSEQEHLPIGLMTGWLWACVGTAYALMTPRRSSRASWTVAVVLIWFMAAVVGIAGPVMVTGTDPTRIPLAVILAPLVAAIVTGLLSLHQANSETDRLAATRSER